MPIRGDVRQALSVALKGGDGMTRELAMRSGVGVTCAMYTLRNMVQAGEVRVVRSAKVAGVKRPVPVYGMADDDAAASAGGINWDLITCWGQWPVQR